MAISEYSARKEALAEREIAAIRSGNTDEFYRIHAELDALEDEFCGVRELKEPTGFGKFAKDIGKAALGLSTLAGLAVTGAAKDMAGSTLDDSVNSYFTEDNGHQFYTDDLDNITYDHKETAPFELYSECVDSDIPFRLRMTLADNYVVEHSNFKPIYNQTNFGLESDEDGNILLTHHLNPPINFGYNGIHDIFMIWRDTNFGTTPFLSNAFVNWADSDKLLVDYDIALELSAEQNGKVIYLEKPLDDRYYDEDNLDKNFSYNEYESENRGKSKTTLQKSDRLNDAIIRKWNEDSSVTYLETKISELISENNLTDADTLDLKLTRSLPVDSITTNINYDSKNNPIYPYFPQVIVPINVELEDIPIDIDMNCYETESISDEPNIDSDELILEGAPVIETETNKVSQIPGFIVGAIGASLPAIGVAYAFLNREYKSDDSLDERSPLPKLKSSLIKDY